MSDQEVIRRVLTDTKVWAVVGCSPDPHRDSHRIAKLLIDHGYDVIPVNPNVDEILGRRCYPSVRDIGRPVDVVDVFRRSDQAGAHIDEAIAIAAKAVWLQLGVFDDAGAEKARDVGLDVVVNRCPAIELPRL